MKRLLLILAMVSTLMAVGLADQRVGPSGVAIRAGNIVDTLVMEGVGSTTTAVDSARNEADDFWNGATITVIEDVSSLTDSTRVITDWVQSTHTFTFSAFASDSLEDNDSISITLPTGHYRTPYTSAWVVDSTVDTSEVYSISPGATISSMHVMTAGEDSVDTRIFLEVALEVIMPSGVSGWYRLDSITNYSTVDTTLFNDWGDINANYIRFVLDPIDAPFINAATATHSGRVMSDK